MLALRDNWRSPFTCHCHPHTPPPDPLPDLYPRPQSQCPSSRAWPAGSASPAPCWSSPPPYSSSSPSYSSSGPAAPPPSTATRHLPWSRRALSARYRCWVRPSSSERAPSRWSGGATTTTAPSSRFRCVLFGLVLEGALCCAALDACVGACGMWHMACHFNIYAPARRLISTLLYVYTFLTVHLSSLSLLRYSHGIRNILELNETWCWECHARMHMHMPCCE
jgi:hypothetical protein